MSTGKVLQKSRDSIIFCLIAFKISSVKNVETEICYFNLNNYMENNRVNLEALHLHITIMNCLCIIFIYTLIYVMGNVTILAYFQDVSTIKWEGMWQPKLEINNTLGEAKQQIWRDVQFNASGEAFALEKRRVKGNFTERMELQEFPFDIQVN